MTFSGELASSNLIRAIGSASEIKLHAFFLVKRASRKIKEALSRAWRWLGCIQARFIALICSNGFFSLRAFHEGCVQRGRGKVRVILECA
jgi:hypothetical protein